MFYKKAVLGKFKNTFQSIRPVVTSLKCCQTYREEEQNTPNLKMNRKQSKTATRNQFSYLYLRKKYLSKEEKM